MHDLPKLRHGLGEFPHAVVVQSQEVVRGNGIRIRLENLVELVRGLRILGMLAVGHGVGKQFVQLDAILGVRQSTVADGRAATT